MPEYGKPLRITGRKIAPDLYGEEKLEEARTTMEAVQKYHENHKCDPTAHQARAKRRQRSLVTYLGVQLRNSPIGPGFVDGMITNLLKDHDEDILQTPDGIIVNGVEYVRKVEE